MKYQTKSVLIDAIQFKDDKPESLIEIQNFMGCEELRVSYTDPEHPVIKIDTLCGVMDVHIGDYILKGTNGEIFPCAYDIFSKTYEPVE